MPQFLNFDFKCFKYMYFLKPKIVNEFAYLDDAIEFSAIWHLVNLVLYKRYSIHQLACVFIQL
mgnify:CR=1 FL=1